jgi:two-component system chemotaxis response regulator CheY
MLLDDSPSIRTILRVFLGNLKAEFIEAGDGERALKLLRVMTPELVVADVRMEPMDGIAFLKAVRSDVDERVRNVPVILLTSDTSPDLEREGRGAGANDFVRKPVSGTRLMQSVNRVLGIAA